MQMLINGFQEIVKLNTVDRLLLKILTDRFMSIK